MNSCEKDISPDSTPDRILQQHITPTINHTTTAGNADSADANATKATVIVANATSFSQNNTIHPVDRRTNASLTKEQKESKKRLKKELKRQTKIHRLRTKIKHAISRKDVTVEKQTREELEKILSSCTQGDAEHNLQRVQNNDDEEFCKQWVLKLANDLFEHQGDAMNEGEAKQSSGTTFKEYQTSKAVQLLKHMTKGTQEISMFDDECTLWGYARQKLYERAMLVYVSLMKLQCDGVTNKEAEASTQLLLPPLSQSCQTLELKQQVWSAIQCGGIRNVYSIGCGCGNDAVGIIALLHTIKERRNMKSVALPLEKVILMDWAIKKWKTVLRPLQSLLIERNLVSSVETCFCDVTLPCSHESNVEAREWISPSSNRTDDFTTDRDIYLISYLVSETRGKWESFFEELIELVKKGTMFYFAEPTPWQLHRMRELFSASLHFTWLDSSMDQPLMQELDRRIGPAVLFAVKTV